MNHILLIIMIVLPGLINAQYSGEGFGFACNYSYTTTSRLYLNPNASDPFTRNQNIPMDDIYGYSLDVRYRLSESIILGINADLITKTGVSTNVVVISDASVISVEAEDGYKLIPLEFSAYYLLPISVEKFKFYMGGGIGIYFGSHIRKFKDVEAVNENRSFEYGIQVAVGMDYMITNFFSVRGEMKFRDPEFEMTSTYSKKEFQIGETKYSIPHDKFDSKVNIDGATFSIGVVFHL
ncbi:MAG: hypothetical protein V1720_00610 [bacterium]